MNLWRLLSCLLRSCWISVSPPATGNVLPSRLWDECSQKKKGGCGVAKDKRQIGGGGRKGSGLLFGMKRERVHFNQNEGSIWFAITPQMISWCLKLIASWSRKFWRGFDSWRPQGKHGVTREPGMCAVHISHAIHPRQNQTTDVSSRWLHLTDQPVTWRRRCREACMETTQYTQSQFWESTSGRRRTETSYVFVKSFHRQTR